MIKIHLIQSGPIRLLLSVELGLELVSGSGREIFVHQTEIWTSVTENFWTRTIEIVLHHFIFATIEEFSLFFGPAGALAEESLSKRHRRDLAAHSVLK